MLTVASVAKIIADYWHGQTIDRQAIVTICLLHDIAKPVTFDLVKQKTFVSSEAYLPVLERNINWLKKNYGQDELQIAIKILSEIGVHNEVKKIMEVFEWTNVQKLLTMKYNEALIAIYADMRVSPKGLVSLAQRLSEVHARAPFLDYTFLQSYAKKVEDYLAQYVNIDIAAIPAHDLNLILPELTMIEI
ncbi:HD domain-containing protein [Candidatus Woesebacteria bacterium]|nr:HD domain-containing protein [Candidatus Woesebacteria bacterium]